jgi:glycosyltransferase involved in cell wall biosynthesis
MMVFFDCVMHFGGSIQITVRTIKEMRKHCEVVVLDAYGVCKEFNRALERFGITSTVLLPNPKYHYIGGENVFLRAGRVLAGSVEMVKLVGRLKRAIQDIRPSAIWTTSQKGLFFLWCAAARDVPIVFFAHGRKSYPRWYNRFAWKRLALVAGVSESSLSRLRGSPYEAAIMEVIYNGIDIDETVKLSSVEAPNIPSNGGIRILLPGTLTENKNQDTAIRGLAKYVHKGGDACLWLAGDFTPGLFDEYARSLPVLAENLNVSDRVHFLGWRNDIPAVMARSDVVVLTSYSEGLPIVLLEAMCLKKPVIATRVGGIPEVVRDGIDGILIEPGDSEGFAGAVSRLADPSLRKKMGQAGFERVESCFDIKVTARRFLEAIDKIC